MDESKHKEDDNADKRAAARALVAEMSVKLKSALDVMEEIKEVTSQCAMMVRRGGVKCEPDIRLF